jgi:L-threonylcarbamoyladenylate synthase
VPDPAAVERAAAIVRDGGIVAYATDTLYALAVDPRDDQAVARLFHAKGRDDGVAIPLIAADLAQAQTVAALGPVELRLADAFWPGPLTIVAPAGPALAPRALAGGRTVAVRVPAHAVARALARAAGHPIAATSANRSGDPAPADPSAIDARLAAAIDALLDSGPAAGGAPSTIVAVRDGRVQQLRAGAVAWERVLEFGQ